MELSPEDKVQNNINTAFLCSHFYKNKVCHLLENYAYLGYTEYTWPWMPQRAPDNSNFWMTLDGKRKEKPSSYLSKYKVQ